ncbi:hypothetical protein LEP1GSC036_2273 [Leptospira weilii str. 2006001853]|uniref:Uncharacterized protein n=1 Tax=Leptospira weilii str. 2006001853 TaxID=1001589 RepID=A0A828Z0B2_9LEPT|nr:hypothetical protein LEP1GSC036_2273 [Leptospira weilii str. 2006001853]
MYWKKPGKKPEEGRIKELLPKKKKVRKTGLVRALKRCFLKKRVA